MKKLEELKVEFPKYFPNWMDEDDIISKLDSMWTSREYWYVDRDGLGTQTIVEANIQDDKCEGYFWLELDSQNRIKVWLEIGFEDWDDDEQTYMMEYSSIVGWDE